jgi:hypothetical protein
MAAGKELVMMEGEQFWVGSSKVRRKSFGELGGR